MKNPAKEKEENKRVREERKQIEERKENQKFIGDGAEEKGRGRKKKENTTMMLSRDPIAKKLAIDQHQRRLETFDRFNEDFVLAYMSEREQVKGKQQNKELSSASPLESFINVSTVEDFTKPERVSKRLSRMGICSRRMAEKLIDQGMVKVDGQSITDNRPVTNDNLLQISAKTGLYTPVKETTRVWLFNKPAGMVTTHFDPEGRVTVFQRLQEMGLTIPHVISVVRIKNEIMLCIGKA